MFILPYNIITEGNVAQDIRLRGLDFSSRWLLSVMRCGLCQGCRLCWKFLLFSPANHHSATDLYSYITIPCYVHYPWPSSTFPNVEFVSDPAL